MALSDAMKKEYARRLLLSRNRVLCNHGFYGMLLMHASFLLDEACETAYTDGNRIAFSPAFMDRISDSELDFVLMHEILHIALQHCSRGEKYEKELFNIACDIVVNSNILKSNDMRPDSITVAEFGESMHQTPKKKEGYLYTAEEVYQILLESGRGGSATDPSKDGSAASNCRKGSKKGDGGSSSGKPSHGQWDDHSKWQIGADDSELQDVWLKRVEDAASVASILDPSNQCGSVPACMERLLLELRKPQTDWRTVLDEFVQEEVCDYTFSPPDRRFDGGDFFLPDFNDKDVRVENILFMVDTSGSISDEMLTMAYSEIKGAIEQFDGKLCGLLGFFDFEVYEPKSFEGVDDVLAIRPKGGGGTSFYAVFDYVRDHMEEPPASIVVLTDGYASMPPEAYANEIPVLWLIDNDDVTPPWGRLARIKL